MSGLRAPFPYTLRYIAYVLVTLLGFSVLLQSFSTPHSDSAPGGLYPPCTHIVTSLAACLTSTGYTVTSIVKAAV